MVGRIDNQIVLDFDYGSDVCLVQNRGTPMKS